MEKVFEQLLIIDSLRGKHSTGAMAVRKHDSEVYVAKQSTNALDFIESQKYSKLTTGYSTVLLGHNRYATVGKVNNNNAHPFDFPNVVGVHNGTLTNKYDLFEGSLYDTDSEAFYSHVNKYGIEEAIKSVQGAYAFVFYDKIHKSLNFIRNKDRTLYIASLRDTKTIVWASESWMIEGILSRNNIKHDGVIPLTEDTLLTFEINKGELDKPRTKKLKGKIPNFSTGLYGGRGNNVTHINKATHSLAGKKGLTLEVRSLVHNAKGVRYFLCTDVETRLGNIRLWPTRDMEGALALGDMVRGDIGTFVHEDGSVNINNASVVLSLSPPFSTDERYKDHKGTYLNKAAWKKQFGTCDWCTADIDPDIDNYSMSSTGEVFCPACMNTDDVKQYIKLA